MAKLSKDKEQKVKADFLKMLGLMTDADWGNASMRFSTNNNLIVTSHSGEIIYNPVNCTIKINPVKIKNVAANNQNSAPQKTSANCKKQEILDKYQSEFKEFKDDMTARLAEIGCVPQIYMKAEGGTAVIYVIVQFPGQVVKEKFPPKNLKKDRAAYIKQVKAAKRAVQKESDTKKKELEAARSRNPLYGSYLAASIVNLVINNKDKITRAGMVKILRGQTLKANHQLNLMDEYGKFSIFSIDEIQEVIQACIAENLIRENPTTGIYGDYKVLRRSWNKNKPCLQMDTPANFGKNKKYAEYRDNDWGAFLDATSPSDIKNASYWKKLLPLLDHPGVYCEKKEKYTAFFAGAPENVKEYIRVSVTLADGVKRRMLEELVKGMDRQ